MAVRKHPSSGDGLTVLYKVNGGHEYHIKTVAVNYWCASDGEFEHGTSLESVEPSKWDHQMDGDEGLLEI